MDICRGNCRVCLLFNHRGGTITCAVTGMRRGSAVSLTTFCTSLLARAMACGGKEALNDTLGSGNTLFGLKIIEYISSQKLSASICRGVHSFHTYTLRKFFGRIIFVAVIISCENICVFNFCTRPDVRKYFNTENFPNYRNMYMYVINHTNNYFDVFVTVCNVPMHLVF